MNDTTFNVLFTVLLYFGVSIWFLGFHMRRRWLLNPAYIFVASQVLMFAGSLSLLNFNDVIDRDHLWQMFIALVCFILGVVIVQYAAPRVDVVRWRQQESILQRSRTENYMLVVILMVSIIVAVAFFVTGGGNVLSQALTARATGDSYNAIEARRSYNFGGSIISPGYALQFRAVLLPLIAVYIFVRSIVSRNRSEFWSAVVLIPVAILTSLGTGQRAAFVDALAITFIFAVAALPRAKSMPIVKSIIGFGAVIFFIATLALGRSTGGASFSVTQVPDVLMESVRRFTNGQQGSSVVGYQYVRQHPDEGHGTVLAGLLSPLPEFIHPKPKVTLASLVFRQIFGSIKGTAAPSIWSTIEYDYGPVSIYVFPLLLGGFYYLIYLRFMHKPKTVRNLLFSSAYSYILGTWVYGGPEVLVNRGMLTLFVLAILLRLRLERRDEPAQRAALPTVPQTN